MRKFNVNVNGNSYSVEIEEVDASAVSAPVAAPVVAPAPVKSAPVAAPAPKAAPAGGVAVKSPMPGTVLEISVADGATVKKGDKLLVLEAMKMENDINAPADGVISFVVKKGDGVESGAILASIK